MGHDRLLTAAELELMTAVWAAGRASVQEVADAQSGPPRAYTTVATLLKILEEKGFVRAEKEGRKAVYEAVVPEDAYRRFAARDLVQRVFHGDAGALVRTLVGEQALTPEEWEALVALRERP